MTRKVRRVDWYPDEYIAGTFGRLTFEEHGAYCCLIFMMTSSEGPIDADYGRIGHAGSTTRRTAQRLVGQLVAKGKLQWTDDGRLSNGRAMIEIGKTLKRVDDAQVAAQLAGDRHATAAKHRQNFSKDQGKSSTSLNRSVRNHQPPTSNHQPEEDSETLSSESVRTRARKAPSKIINGGQHDDDERQRLPNEWVPSADEVDFARGLGLDPEAVADAYRLWWSEGKGRREARSAKGWAATWRGWCRRDAERRGGGASSANGSPNRPARGGGLAGAAARVRARYHGT